MILVDFSSIIHRMIHTSKTKAKPIKENGKFITSEFIGLAQYYIFQELFSINQEFGQNFGNIIICLDESSNGYWRKDVYPAYKISRKLKREESDINYKEIFEYINILTDQIKTNLPWKVVQVPRAEADDIMLVLAREFNTTEKILIHSPDKDMIQAQRKTDNVFQYSKMSRKWIVPENKNGDMAEWIMEHVCLGDTSDDVPKIVDGTEFSINFLKFLKKEKHQDIQTPMDFKAKLEIKEKKRLVSDYDVYKKNRKQEPTGIKDIYKDTRFGPTTLKKKLEKFGSLDKWLDSHPLYRPHYNRNLKLVMEEGIPTDIWNECIIQFKKAEINYNPKEFEQYLIKSNLKSLLMDLPNVFKINRELTADDFGW